jgi:hypothetical protein
MGMLAIEPHSLIQSFCRMTADLTLARRPTLNNLTLTF